MDSFFSRNVCPLVLVAGTTLLVGCNDDPVVWPISAEAAGDWTFLSATYGPHIRTIEEKESYEFHRGIDILVPERTDVHAIARGTVQLIEQITDVGGMRVQVQHDGYVANYLHLLKVEAAVGDIVDPGDYIAISGVPNEGPPHLHFEVRQPGVEKQDCIHPLRVLPYFDRGAPIIEFGTIDTTIPGLPKVTVRVTVRNRELDLIRVSAATFEAPRDAILDGLEPLSQQSWDMEKWNAEQAILGDEYLTNALPNGIEVRPEAFSNVSDEQRIEFTFTQLQGPLDATNLRIRVEAADIKGNVASLTSP